MKLSWHAFGIGILLCGMFAVSALEVRAQELPAEPPVEDAAVVATGDAAATTDSADEVNMTEVTSEPETTVVLENDATAEADAAAEASTGENTAAGGEGDALVITGDAYASATSIQVINTNIIDSNGLLLFHDLFGALGIDLRALDLSYFTTTYMPAASSSCAVCGGVTSLTVDAANNATTTASVSATASTGGNLAEGENALVATGNAYASANGVQIVNSNIIKSNYLLIGLNDFGNLTGDFTLPAADFFASLFNQSSAATGPLDVTVENNATVTSDTSADAATGDNTATGEGDAVVLSGDAVASASNLTKVNTTEVGGTEIFFLFRIWGNWNGTVHGLPDGVTWEETGQGVVLHGTSGGGLGSGGTTLSTQNNALADLGVHAYALTGDNRADASEGDAAVLTGNAYAAANSVQLVNTTLLGKNWIYAIFNIFGDFNGNIAFGHPDLWVGAVAETGNPTLPGSEVRYRFTVTNHGDADAHNVRLSTTHTPSLMRFSSGMNDTGAVFSLGTIRKGETQEFTYDAIAGEVPGGDTVAVPLSVTATSEETDEDMKDNTDELLVVITDPSLTRILNNKFHEGRPPIDIHKSADRSEVGIPGSTNYTVTVQNNGGTVHDAVLTDTLFGPDGKALKTQSWNLETLHSHEEVTITYTLVLDEHAAPGVYKNVARLSDSDHLDPKHAPTTEYSITAVPGECPEYLTSFIRKGEQNNPDDVRRLQDFLINSEGEEDVQMTGEYDDATFEAVKRFQAKHLDEIIAPWGGASATGYVYLTTRTLINNLYCGGARTFGLSDSEKQEIADFRTAYFTRRAAENAPIIPDADLLIGRAAPAALPREEEDGGAPQQPKPREPWWIKMATSVARNLVASANLSGFFR